MHACQRPLRKSESMASVWRMDFGLVIQADLKRTWELTDILTKSSQKNTTKNWAFAWPFNFQMEVRG